MVCVPAPIPAKASSCQGGAAADVFSFSGADGAEALTRNWWALMALPWAAVWAVQSEMIEETLRRMGL
ncbi:MAG: hypothetical protein ACU0DT_00315 [Albimonas sp.]|uniref:hypothetical protein n=1 Tax=Albimonas sp. TaxID=1872425 RepID=UPI004057B6CB|tara:strand:- start:98 stop:301 length:204 start_codon:yes stop_codon:yes gene_type:complete